MGCRSDGVKVKLAALKEARDFALTLAAARNSLPRVVPVDERPRDGAFWQKGFGG